MCVICYKAKNKKLPSVEEIIKMWNKNPDGAGLMWIGDNGKVGWRKGFMSRKSLTRFIRHHEEYLNERDVALHFRITTHGGTSRGNTHPFAIDMDADPHALEGEADTVLMHNGMLSVNPRFNTISDSAELALRAGCYENPLFFLSSIDEFLEGSRILVFDKDGAHFYGDKFVESDGLLYSNLNHRNTFHGYGYHYGYGRIRDKFDSPEGGRWTEVDDGWKWTPNGYVRNDRNSLATGTGGNAALTQADKDFFDRTQGEGWDYGF